MHQPVLVLVLVNSSAGDSTGRFVNLSTYSTVLLCPSAECRGYPGLSEIRQ